MSTNMNNPIFQANQADGTPAVGYKMYTYQAGTLIPLTTYQDYAATITNTNPIILDSNGNAKIWITANAKFIFKTDQDVTIWTMDNLKANGANIYDDNGNALLTFTGVAAAVNNFNITNAAAGNAPILSAIGTDTNIGINIVPKGTGTINMQGTATSSAEVRLFEQTTNGVNYIGLKSPNIVANNVTFKVPGADGAANSIMVTDGSANLSLQTKSALNIASSGANTDITSVLLNQTGLVVKGATANALTIKPNETYTVGRTLNLILNDADRTVNVNGNVSIGSTFSTSGTFAASGNVSIGSTFSTSGAVNLAAAFTTSGANSLTLTTTGSTNVTLPTSGTLQTVLATVNTIKQQVFTASGTYTPSAGMLYCIVEVIGAGAGGGGAANSGAGGVSGAGGGGAGAYCRSNIFSAATIGSSQPVTVGTGGSGGAAGNNNGVAGGNSVFGSGPLVTATGGSVGSGAASNSSGNGGAGGTGSGSATVFPGGNGSCGIGQTILTVTAMSGGRGGSCLTGSGAISTSPYGAGVNGVNYGSGGQGGSNSAASGATAGGNGANGIVIITEFCNQ